MNRNLKIFLYVALAIAACVFTVKFHGAYSAAKTARENAFREPAEPSEESTNTAPAVLTNQTPLLPGTNASPTTNQLLATNMALGTNASATNAAPTTTEVASQTGKQKQESSSITTGLSGMVLYGALCFGCIVGIGVLLAYDISHFAAERFSKFILSDDGESFKDPEYESAEKLWANGQHLEAIQLMRDYLRKNPRKLFIAIRIAEIYEKDLGNYLAAALEYEEVLKHRLLPEQWGWSAIHLANLYSGKLNQPDKAMAWLRRIVTEHNQTAAAAKARSRLEQMEGGMPEPAEGESQEPPPPSLPKGFRPLSDK